MGKIEGGLTARRLLEWEGFATLEPWFFDTETREDWRSASIRQSIYNGFDAVIATMASMFSKQRRRPKAMPIKDFVIPFDHPEEQEKKQPTEQQLWDKMKLFTVMMTGQDIPPDIEGKGKLN